MKNFLQRLIFTISLIAVAVSADLAGGQTPESLVGQSRTFVISEDVRLHSRIYGDGPVVVLLPGRGGSGIEQFAELGKIIAKEGYTAVLIDPRGVGESVGPLESLTLHDLASDIAFVIEEFDKGPAIVIGRAFGNRIARCVAADHPELVQAVVLVAAGGLVPMSEDVRADFVRLFSSEKLSEEERLELIHRTLYASDSDPRLQLRLTSYDAAGKAQTEASQATPLDDWWAAGQAPGLIVQGLEDRIAVPENGYLLKQKLGDRAKLVNIPKAGHSLYLEKPVEVANAILEYLRMIN